jgi:DNA-binding CsgD family transcriptional regulator
LAVHKLVDRPLPNGSRVDALTDRELHVFALLGSGLGTGRIAKELGLSPRTIETYHEHIKLKLGYANARELHRGAREWFAPGQSQVSLVSQSGLGSAQYPGSSRIGTPFRIS